MEMFAALVEAKGKGKSVVEENAAYLSIQLEEIVIVKNDDVASLGGAARGSSSTLTSGYSTSTSMGHRVAAAAAPPSWGDVGSCGCRGPKRVVDDRELGRWLG